MIKRIAESFRRADRGSAAVGFGLVLPILMILTTGVIELTIIAFDYHRTGEAARRAARAASMMGPITELTEVENGNTILCKYMSGAVNCGAATILDATIFTKIVDEVKAVVPDATEANVEIRYEPSGLGDPNTPAGILPILNLTLTDIRHDFLMMQFINGVGTGITLPDVEVTTISSSVDAAAATP